MKKWIEYSILIAILIPLFFINIKSSHDWGDDFAQYIHQAKNILSGVPQNETGYVFNENNFIGPQAYPVGFPLLLSPVIAFKGLDILSLNYFMTLFLALSGFMGFMLLRKFTSLLASLFSVIILLYHPVILGFKTEVLSDLPFTFFSLTCIYLMYRKEDIGNLIALGVLIGFTIHIRSIGFVLLLTYLIYKIKQNGFKTLIQRNTSIVFGLSIAVYFLIKLLFPYNANYPISLAPFDLWFNVNDQLADNLDHLYLFFRKIDNPSFYYVGIIASACLIAFGLSGFFYFMKENKNNPITIYFLLYMSVIVLFQLGHAGMRFLIPLLFFVFLFAIVGLRQSISSLTANTKFLPVIFGLVILCSYNTSIASVLKNEAVISDGPQIHEAQEVFDYIKTKVNNRDIISFTKPRALALYTDKKSIALSTEVTYSTFRKELKKFGVNYILINNNDYSNSEETYFVKDTVVCKSVFKNNQFALYKIIKTDF